MRAALVSLMLLASPAFAQLDEPAVVTQHQIRVDGKALKYTAHTGRIAIRDAETGAPRGHIFAMTYRVASKKPRPVTFVWNGGPGANSATLHFDVAGPKRLDGDALVENADTWLTRTDLVFVDPVGTGFSRPAKAEYAEEFYGTVGDVNSIIEFVRAWVLLNDAQGRPLYLAGESWGAGRAASVGYGLLKRGFDVAGLLLISGGSGLRLENPPKLLDALEVVDLAVTAAYHGKTQIDRKAAEAWVRDTYAPALERVETLTDSERDRIVQELANIVGLAPDQIDRKTLRFTPRQYLTGLLKDQGKTLNIFDMRRVNETANRRERDVITRYLRQDLGYRTSLPYVGLERLEDAYGTIPNSVGARWNYATAKVSPEEMKAAIAEAIKRGGGPPRLGPPLPATAEAIALNPKMKVLVATGLYDSLGSCARDAEMPAYLAPDVRNAVTFKCYVGGHMMYHDAPTRVEFSADVRRFVSE